MIEGPSRPRLPKPAWGKFLGGLPSAPWGRWPREKFQQFRQWIVPPQGEGRRSDAFLWRLQLVERICWVVLIALGAYLIVDLFFIQLRPPVAAVLPGRPGPEAATPSAGLSAGHLKPVADYQTTLASRNPFGLSRLTQAKGPAEPEATGIAQVVKTLIVVGLSRGRVPEALIEDTVSQRTHVVKIGESFNGLTVKKIDAQGVTVSDGREEALIQ